MAFFNETTKQSGVGVGPPPGGPTLCDDDASTFGPPSPQRPVLPRTLLLCVMSSRLPLPVPLLSPRPGKGPVNRVNHHPHSRSNAPTMTTVPCEARGQGRDTKAFGFIWAGPRGSMGPGSAVLPRQREADRPMAGCALGLGKKRSPESRWPLDRNYGLRANRHSLSPFGVQCGGNNFHHRGR
ncbi:hypothetical protein VUR80DRAFT_6589 [Thermomyces stellatus]